MGFCQREERKAPTDPAHTGPMGAKIGSAKGAIFTEPGAPDRKGFLSGSNLPQGWGFQSVGKTTILLRQVEQHEDGEKKTPIG